ncbi:MULTISPECIES: IS30 family transposase, partial [unclassified Granulicatella]
IFKQYGKKWFKSITADNGSEFSRLTELESYLTAVYFAHPYASYERGTNENHNGLIREFLPKGKSFNLVPIQMITTIQNALNNRPRRILDYDTPHTMFNRLCATT